MLVRPSSSQLVRPGTGQQQEPKASDVPSIRLDPLSESLRRSPGEPPTPIEDNFMLSDAEHTLEAGRGALARELKDHLLAIERKVDEISAKVDRGYGAVSSHYFVPNGGTGQAEAPESMLRHMAASPRFTTSQRPSIASLHLPAGPSPRRASVSLSCPPQQQRSVTEADRLRIRRQSIQAMRRMSKDLRNLGDLPGGIEVIESENAAEDDTVQGSPREDEEQSTSDHSSMSMAAEVTEVSRKTVDAEEKSKRRPSVEARRLGKMRSHMAWTMQVTEQESIPRMITRRMMGSSARRVIGSLASQAQEAQVRKETQLMKIVKSVPFQLVVGVAIVLNAVFIGVRADIRLASEIRGEAEPVGMAYIEFAFFAFFAIELGIRLVAERMLFLIGPEWKWNLFDSLLVMSSLVDSILNGISDDGSGVGNVTAARMVRFARFVRIMRIVRAVRSFHALRIVVYAIFESIMSLFWCFIVLCLIIYMFAVFFQQGVMEHYSVLSSTDANKLLSLYGDNLRAMVTLFMTISGGVDWRDAMLPLKAMHWTYEPIFNFYVFFMVIGVLNVVVGAFVATTAEIISKDRDALVKAETSNLASYQRKVKTFFNEADTDKSGKLSWEEFKAHLKIPKVASFFRALELDVTQAHVVFKLLDADGSNEVSLDEFLAGCLRLKGQAKSIDVNMLLYENKRLFNRLSEFIRFCSDLLLKDKEFSDVQVPTWNDENESLSGSPRGRRRTCAPAGASSAWS